MKLLTFYSESHRELYETFFLESYNKFLKDKFELKDKLVPQHSKSGDYGSDGFAVTMLEKVNHIINNIDTSDETPMVFADCDIQFFGDFSEDITNQLGDCDIKFQNDIACVCAGFFVCKQNEKVLNFFNDVKKTLNKVMHQKVDDQQVINSFLTNNTHPNLKHGLLPTDKYFTVASSDFGVKQWNGQDFTVPKSVLVHHGNWTVGMSNKFKIMEKVKNDIRG